MYGVDMPPSWVVDVANPCTGGLPTAGVHDRTEVIARDASTLAPARYQVIVLSSLADDFLQVFSQ
jgi:hypothetical protein